MDEEHSLRFLLQKLEIIRRAATVRGETQAFNVFSILRGEREEVGLHTAFLHTLLDPRGSHGLGHTLLAVFLKEMGVKLAQPSDLDDAEVHRERRHRDVGQIDLFIELRRAATVIVVENKIDAGDQDRQLERYEAHARAIVGAKGNVVLLYLTLNEGTPSPGSLGNLPLERVRCISYCADVLRWLARCVEKAATFPMLRETLVQYAELIKKLTGQSMSDETRDQILELLTEGNNAEVAQLVVANWNHLKWRTTWHFWEDMEEAVKRWTGMFPGLRVADSDKYSYENLNNLYFRDRSRTFDFGLTVILGRLAGTVADNLFVYLSTSDDGGPAFYGFGTLRAGEWDSAKTTPTHDALAARMPLGMSRNNWWLGYRSFQTRTLDFVNYSNADTRALANPQKRAEAIEALCSEVEETFRHCGWEGVLESTCSSSAN